MNKEQIIQSIRQAIEVDPNKKDILKVSLFGSQLHGTSKENSDIDILIEFSPNASISFFKLFDTQYNFENFTGKRIDLLTPESISKYFRKEVLAQAETIYER